MPLRLATFLITTLCVIFSLNISAQSLYEISLDEKVRRSSLIVEGRIISQESFWNPQHTMIYTSNKVEIYKIFKGSESSGFIEIMTVGGTVGTENITATDLLELSKEDIGVFFCYPNSINLRSPGTNQKLYDIWSSSQGFLKYDDISLTANAPFARISDISNNLYSVLEGKTGRTFEIIRPYSLSGSQIPNGRTQVVSVTSFSPATVNAGATIDVANNELTITGTGFGTASGVAAVMFDDANDGTGGAFIIVAFNSPLIVSWSSTSIVVKVPSRAGTGSIIVRDDVGGTGSSATNLIVNYAMLTAQITDGTTTVIKESNLMDRNGSGGHTVLYSTSTAGSGVNLDAAPEKATFQRALNTWKELPGLNFIEGGTTAIQVVTNDGSDVIMFDNTNTGQAPLPAGVLGSCFSYNSMCLPVATNQIQKRGFDIIIRNAAVSLGATTFTIGPCPPASSAFSEIDLETVLLHELGHALNLAHINDSYEGSFLPNINPGKLMNFAVVNGVKRSTPDQSAFDGALYAITAQGNTYGTCGLSGSEMTQLSQTVESKDECPVFPTTALPNNTVVPFDLVHATSNKFTDPQYTALNCAATGTGVTNTAYYAFKTAATGGGVLIMSVSGYATTPAAQASCSPSTTRGVELALYAVSSCPAGQAFPAPTACRTFNANGALTSISGLAANTTYLLIADGIENTKASFSLTFGGTVLPIRLQSFTGKEMPDFNQLKWMIDYSYNVKELVLEKSADGSNFTPIYSIDGNNIAQNGLYNDARPFTGNNYYRLAVENLDGTKEYSTVVLLNRKEKFMVSVYPNPASSKIKVEISSQDHGKYNFDIYNMAGQLTSHQTKTITQNQQVVELPVNTMAPGSYLLKISNDKNEILRSITIVVN